MALQPDALYQCLLEDTNSLRVGPAVSFAISQLRLSFFKKLKARSSEELDNVAYLKFQHINQMCGNWRDRSSEMLFGPELLGHFREELHRFFEPNNTRPLITSFEQLMSKGRFGPGVSRGGSYTDLYSKIGSQHLTATSDIFFRVFRGMIGSEPAWRLAEFLRTSSGYRDEIVAGNKLAFVPKNDETSRTICIEPGLNMFAQLGLAALMEKRLKAHFGVDLSTQPDINRELARIGSIANDLCTIDLESASDSISWPMIQNTFPRDVVSWLRVLRSPTSETREGQVQLNMVSTMGNGFTFPLETIIFCCVISACRSYLGLRRERAGKTWSVFGDDIIVPKILLGPVLDLLDVLGFSVNTKKSFFEGPFRESCGADYYEGQQVRGVYLKSLDTVQDRLIAINRLLSWSCDHGVVLNKTISYLRQFVPKDCLVPMYEPDYAGIRVPARFARHLKVGHKWRYKRYIVKPWEVEFTDSKITSNAKGRSFNPEALFMSILRGDVVQGKLAVRHDSVKYLRHTVSTLNWGVKGWEDIASFLQGRVENPSLGEQQEAVLAASLKT